MDVGQEIDDDRGQEGLNQIHQIDFVDFVLFGYVQIIAFATTNENSHKSYGSWTGK